MTNNFISQQIWFAVNKNGSVFMFLDEPIRDGNKWKGNYPYVNSKIQNEINALVQQAQMNFEMDPQCIEIQFEKIAK